MKTIYKITCECNNKIYIGQTKQFDIRKREHINDLKAGRHANVYLQEDYNLFGNKFSFDIIEIVEDDIGNEREDYWMSYYGGINNQNLYNAMNSYTKSDNTKQKLHNYYVGRSHSELYGVEKAEEMRRVNALKHIGKKAVYTPYKGKVKNNKNEMIEVTEDLYNEIMKLKISGYKMTEIVKITGIKYNGIYNIVNNKMYLPFKCND